MQPFHSVKCATIYYLQVDVHTKGKIFRGFEHLRLSCIVLSSLKDPKCLNIAQDFLTVKELQTVLSCTFKSNPFEITNQRVGFQKIIQGL